MNVSTFQVYFQYKEKDLYWLLAILVSFVIDGAPGETEAGVQQNKSITYDLSKLVNYPGFNTSTPRGIPDVSILGFFCSFEV